MRNIEYSKMLQSFIRNLFVLPIKGYQIFISPMLGSNCRFRPTCSSYMKDSILEWGILKGTWMGIKRIGRCHPWNNDDPFDPVPKKENTSNKFQ